MATIRITNLKLRTIIGINDWEREKKQDVILNLSLNFDATCSSQSDDIHDTIDYKTLTKRIIKEVEASEFYLLEKLAQVVLDLVMEDKRVEEGCVRIDKPGALRFCDSVSIELRQQSSHKAVISLGSNINPEENINNACDLLKKHVKVLDKSTFVKTKPIGYKDQDDFLNGAVYVETQLSEHDLKETLKTLEKELGREVSSIKFGPRTIDLDIVVFNEKVVDDDFYSRDFLKTSVLELLPNLNY